VRSGSPVTTLSQSSLNRIPVTVFDLGLNKSVVVAARRVAELDPYLPISLLRGGPTPDTTAEFFDDLDLVVEECDSLDMKLLVRRAARANSIPVFAETGDGGLLGVERFDLEPTSSLFHGLLGDCDPDSLAGHAPAQTVRSQRLPLDAIRHPRQRLAGIQLSD
jgi:hypothetical protein